MNKEKKKVLLVSPAYPYRGGQALVEAYLHNAISQLGYNTSTISYTLLYPSIFFPGTTQFDKSQVRPFEHSGKIKRIINSINPFSWIKTLRYVKKEKPDAVIFVWWMPFFAPALGFIARKIRKRFKETKVVFLVENYISHESRWFDHWATKHTLKYGHAFICQSAYIKQQIRSGFPETPIHKTTLSIYDCYNLGRYDNASAKQLLEIETANVILFFGLIRPYKGVDKLIETFAELVKEKPDTTLLIVGENYEDIAKYQTLIARLGVSRKVKLINKFIDNEDVEPYFKSADVVVLPYYSGTQSGILMMAYGFRVPVVVTDVGGIAELVQPRKTGLVAQNNQVQHLLPAITEILNTKDVVPYSDEITRYTHQLGYVNMGNILEEILQ